MSVDTTHLPTPTSTMSSPTPNPRLNILILGGGIAGLSSALALTLHLPTTPQITVYELRPSPATIGGAINLTPNALRYLNQFGALDRIKQNNHGATIDRIDMLAFSGAKLAEIDFSNAAHGGEGFGSPPFKGMRLMRSDLQQALLDTIATKPNIQIQYGKKVVTLDETPDSVAAHFEDGTASSPATLALGCDGVHSTVRSIIDPARKPVYSGIAAVNGYASLPAGTSSSSFNWKDTSLTSSRRGSLMASFYEPSRTSLYIGAVMEVAEVESQSKDGWRTKGSDRAQVKADLLDRFRGNASLGSVIESLSECSLYPVFILPPKGKWASQRVMLLGDAAHAMPPKGESVGIALEDVIVFARLLGLGLSSSSGSTSSSTTTTTTTTTTATTEDSFPPSSQPPQPSIPHPSLPPIATIFAAYERTRRPRIDAAYADAAFGFQSLKDCGALLQWVKDAGVAWYLWWTAQRRNRAFEEDCGAVDLNLDLDL